MPEWWDRYHRWMYRGGRPNRWARPQNRISAVIGGLVPTRMVALEVTGRRTGRMISFPLAVADYDGERYRVSMLGRDANWVRNIRAANGRAVLRHGRRRDAVHLEEVDVSARAPILRRYLDRAPGARPHILVDRHAPLGEFEQIAAQYPVFRIAPRPAGPQRRDREAVSAVSSSRQAPLQRRRTLVPVQPWGSHLAASTTLRPRWVRVSAWLAVAAALPTVLWRVVVGFGAQLGTPEQWRAAEHIPGDGTVYVLVLSLLQLAAALLTLLLAHPRSDHVPGWSPIAARAQLPALLVAAIALLGAAVLLFLCVASAINWGNVDPFAGVRFTGWAALSWACYAAAPL
jgi:deazaflavin-dependent oxidoreductase (nitroreductase family)